MHHERDKLELKYKYLHKWFCCFLTFFLQSVSAFSPICNPVHCPWGQKALAGYLGSDKETWKVWISHFIAQHDVSALKKRVYGQLASSMIPFQLATEILASSGQLQRASNEEISRENWQLGRVSCGDMAGSSHVSNFSWCFYNFGNEKS